MKKISLLLIGFIAGITSTVIISWKNNKGDKTGNQTAIATAKHPDNRAILAVRKVKLKPGITAEAFESFAVKVAAGEFGNLPGAKFYFGKGERGDEPGSYLSFIEFDSKATRDFYAPVAEDNTKTSAEVTKMLNAYFSKYNVEFNKLAEVITVTGKKNYTDYIILK
ncbi:MAG: hypothetical protein ABR503_06660 [Chitinophagaceae bacterium]